MAPLAVDAGGWGQIEGFKSKEDAKYKKIAKLVDDCIIKSRQEYRDKVKAE